MSETTKKGFLVPVIEAFIEITKTYIGGKVNFRI